MPALLRQEVHAWRRLTLTPPASAMSVSRRPQRLAGEMDGDERAGARRVDRDGGPCSSGGTRCAQAAPHWRFPRTPGRGTAVSQQLRVVARAAADEDPALHPLAARPGVACVLQRVPRLFQEQPLLRIHVRRLGARDLEEQRIEGVDGVEKATAVAECLVRLEVLRESPPLDGAPPGRSRRPDDARTRRASRNGRTVR